jgi:hypothetical protein
MNKIFIVIVFIYIYQVLFVKKYFKYLPTIPIYSDNKEELEAVKNKIKNRTKEDIRIFKLTDRSVSELFALYVKESVKELDIITLIPIVIINFLKTIINRARPYHIDKKIDYLKSKTDKTPAYPAGHAFQAYYLAKILTKRYPNLKELFQILALKCVHVREAAGIHYPSDGIFAKQLVDFFN